MKTNIYMIFCLIATAILVYCFDLDLVDFTFLINSIFSFLVLIFLMKKKISVMAFVFIFNLLFLSLVPWLQYKNSVYIWSREAFYFDDYLWTNLVIFISFLCMIFGRFIISNKITMDFNTYNISKVNLYGVIFVFLLCILSFLIVFYSRGNSLLALFFRSGVLYDIENNFSLNIISTIVRFIPLFLLLSFSSNNNKLIVVILFIFVLLCAFPTGIPRYYVSYIYMPILFVYIKWIRKNIIVIPMVLLSVFFVFPFLNQFRYYSQDLSISIFSGFEFIYSGHFDAYQNLMSVIKFSYVTYGYQLLGVLLFFVPRSLWDNKPFGSGYTIAEEYNFIFNNISMPYIGEGYINFGFLGVIIFSIFLGMIMKKIDYYLIHSEKNNLQYGYGVFLCAAIFFVQRGDLLSSFSVIIAVSIAYLIVCKVVRFINIKGK